MSSLVKDAAFGLVVGAYLIWGGLKTIRRGIQDGLVRRRLSDPLLAKEMTDHDAVVSGWFLALGGILPLAAGCVFVWLSIGHYMRG